MNTGINGALAALKEKALPGYPGAVRPQAVTAYMDHLSHSGQDRARLLAELDRATRRGDSATVLRLHSALAYGGAV